MDPEIASFVMKFKNLCHAGKSANLSLTSKTGKVSVNLSVEIGGLCLPHHVPLHHVPPPPLIPQWHRNGSSRVRRRQKREEARKLFAEEARKELSAEEAKVIEHAEKAENEKASDLNEDPKETVNVFGEVSDEICSDNTYHEPKAETEEVDKDELARDKNVEKVIVYAVTKPIEKKTDVEQEIHEKFASIDVKVKGIKTKTDYRGLYEKSLVEISKVNLNLIWGRRLGLNNCSVIAYEE